MSLDNSTVFSEYQAPCIKTRFLSLAHRTGWLWVQIVKPPLVYVEKLNKTWYMLERKSGREAQRLAIAVFLPWQAFSGDRGSIYRNITK